MAGCVAARPWPSRSSPPPQRGRRSGRYSAPARWAWAGPASAQIGESILRYEVDITVERSSDLRIVERIDYDFGDNTRHGILREIPDRFHFDDVLFDHSVGRKRLHRVMFHAIAAPGLTQLQQLDGRRADVDPDQLRRFCTE